MKIWKSLVLTLAAAALVTLESHAGLAGKAAPDFSLPGIDGKTHTLSDYRGKIVVLEWTNYGCPFVRKHYGSGNMQKLQAESAEQGVVWFSICSSAEGRQGSMSVEEWRAASAAKQVRSAGILLDTDGTVGKRYGARATPHMFVIDEEGLVAYDGAIDSIPSANTSDIARAENYVVAALDALRKGESVAKASTRPYGCSIKWAR